MTQDEDIGSDATELFNYLTTGFTPKRDYKKLLVAPKLLKKGLIARIEREIALHKPEAPGHLFFKMNALEDLEVVRALYKASMAGVRVDLLVRDSCRLRPGIPGLSDNIRIVSIVGRFLEHSRVYYFQNGGQSEYFIGSADAMKRNLENRVEVLVPVEDLQLQAEIATLLGILWDDHRGAWDMQSDGTYVRRTPEGRGETRSSQEVIIELAEKRHKGSTRLKKRRASAPAVGGRNLES
jgi:polyphosphate kinase